MTTDRQDSESARNTPDPDDFDAAFDEMAEAESAGTDTDDAAYDAEAAQQEGQDDTESRDTSDQQDDLEEDDNDDTEKPETPDPKQTDQTDDDLLKEAPPELRNAFEALREKAAQNRHKASSSTGRVASLQRQVRDLNQQLKQAEEAKKKDPSPSEADTETGVEFEDPEIQAFFEDYSDVAKPVKKLMDQMAAQLKAQGQNTTEPTGTDTQQPSADDLAEQNRLLAAYPDAFEIADNQSFHEWLTEQSDEVREDFYQNADGIKDANAASRVIGNFKQAMAQTSRQPQNPNTPPQTGGTTQPRPQNPKRQAQLETATGVAPKGRGQPSGPPEDFDKAFEFYADQED